MVDTSNKGGRIERKVRFFLEQHGYEVYRARLSKGIFDLVATRNQQLTGFDGACVERRFIQVKANQWRMPHKDLTIMSTIPLPEGAVREYIRHDDHPSRSGLCSPKARGEVVQCLRARRVAEDGSWSEIAVLPEWESEHPLEGLDGAPAKP